MNQNRFIHKFKTYDIKIVVYIMAIIGAISLISNFVPLQEPNRVEVYHDNNLLFNTTINAENEFIVTVSDSKKVGTVTIHVQWGKVRVKSSDFSSNSCIKQGWINSTNKIINCTENRLVVKVKKDSHFQIPGTVLDCDLDTTERCKEES